MQDIKNDTDKGMPDFDIDIVSNKEIRDRSFKSREELLEYIKEKHGDGNGLTVSDLLSEKSKYTPFDPNSKTLGSKISQLKESIANSNNENPVTYGKNNKLK